MIGELILTIGIALISYAIYKYHMNNKRYFEERNVKYKGLSFSLYNLYAIIFGKNTVFEFAQRHYEQHPDVP